ncbi:hypothetical protein X943_003205 [Babesia divergens]|uniref:Uncharacterized protein n=1 Tax=Babesia divergens TaxID=32595 RepID=A0AAD9LH19_BABDI|nr:hypothetical protein X943_003205 [Babesia divergens]
MGAINAFEEAPNGASDGTEASFQSLDIERLFVDSDEMTVMKTLQNMHLANFQLDNEIKSVMTDEIDPILLYSANMLGICSLIKQAQTAMNELATLCRTFEAGSGDMGSGKDMPKNDEEEVLRLINHCAMQYQLDGSFGSIFEKYGRFKRRDAMIRAVQMLKRLSMDNFRLLKANKFVASYKLLKVMSPALMALVRHVIQHEDTLVHPSSVDCTDVRHGGKYAAGEEEGEPMDTACHSRRLVISALRPEHFRGFLRETQSVLDYNTAKLLNHCQAALGSSDMGLLIEASICLSLANENDTNYPSRMWEIRLNSTKVESSRMAFGCLSSCQVVMSQLLASVMYHIFCQRLSTEAITRIKRLLEVPVHASNEVKPTQKHANESSPTEQSYWVSAMDLISRNFERVELNDIVDFYNGLIGVIEAVPETVGTNKLLLNVFSEIGVDLVQQVTSASEDILKQVKELYHKNALASAMLTVEDVERRMQSRETCTTHIKALGKFVAKADTSIVAAVNQRMADALNRIGAEIQSVEDPVPADGVLDTYGHEGSVERWLVETRLNNVIFNMEALWYQIQNHSTALLEIVARKCIVPLGGDDNTVKTLVGAGALGSQYSLLGARLFPQCLKRASLEYCLIANGDHNTRDKAILVLSFRDSGLTGDSETLAERFKELELEVGETALQEHTAAYKNLCNFI